MLPLIVSILIFISGFFGTPFDEPVYSIKNIPEELMNDNHAVIREDITSFNIPSVTSAKLTHKFVVTLLDGNADQFTSMVIPYDRNIKVLKFEGRAYDSGGKTIYKLKSSDIIDHSAADGFSLYQDDRLKYARIVPPFYPCTIEFYYELGFNGMISYPGWIPVKYANVSVENSGLNISVPDDMHLRYKEFNLKSPVKILQNNNSKIYQWKINNFKAIRFEPFMPALHEVLPAVYTAPDKFELDGFKGNMSSWKDFGEWAYNLNKGRDSLTSGTISKIRSLVSNTKDEKERIRILYDYLKNNTRYVSIQLGIGGYQTFEASFVDNHGYGDCKALSNYMLSLLRIINVRSYLTLVKAGDDSRDILYDFPSQQFNHAILCVPLRQDTLWLECTNQHNPFSFLGRFTGNRHVLIITEKGGILSHTPAFSKTLNLQIRTGEVNMASDGKSTARIKTVDTGLQYDQIKSVVHADYDTQKKWLYNQIGIPDFTIDSFKLSEDINKWPAVTENLTLSLNRYVSVSGSRLFCQLNLMNQLTKSSVTQDERLFDMVFNFPFIDRDSLIYHVPAGYKLEFVPDPVNIQSPFGNYSMQVTLLNDNIIYKRELESNSGRFSKDLYPSYREFVQKIISTDKKKIVLVKSR